MRFLFQQSVFPHETSGFYSILVSWVSPVSTKTPVKCPQYLHQNWGGGERRNRGKQEGKEPEHDKSECAKSPEEVEPSGTDQQEERNADALLQHVYLRDARMVLDDRVLRSQGCP